MSDAMERLATGEYARAVENRGGSGMSDIPAQLSEPMTLMRTKDVKHLADRIEELEGKLRKSALQELSALGQASEAYQAQLAAEAKLSKCEALLAKAVAAIEEMQIASDAMMLHIARTTLAELKSSVAATKEGGSDE